MCVRFWSTICNFWKKYQRIWIKFFYKNEIKCCYLLEMLTIVLARMLWVKQWLTRGINVSIKAVKTLKMSSALKFQQQHNLIEKCSILNNNYAEWEILRSPETWIYGYNVEVKAQSSQRRHPETTSSKKLDKPKMFFDFNRILHPWALVPTSKDKLGVLLRVLSHLREAVWQIHPELQQHNALVFTSLLVHEFLAKSHMPSS